MRNVLNDAAVLENSAAADQIRQMRHGETSLKCRVRSLNISGGGRNRVTDDWGPPQSWAGKDSYHGLAKQNLGKQRFGTPNTHKSAAQGSN